MMTICRIAGTIVSSLVLTLVLATPAWAYYKFETEPDHTTITLSEFQGYAAGSTVTVQAVIWDYPRYRAIHGREPCTAPLRPVGHQTVRATLPCGAAKNETLHVTVREPGEEDEVFTDNDGH
jgi:hypothetical protein